MSITTYITTSWDDGHPLDARIAELLTKYGLRGTFYIPRSIETGTMTSAALRDLSQTFEVGAHTLHHTDLTQATVEEAEREIVDSRAWVEACTGLPCTMFCPPKGKFARRDLALLQRAGFVGVRSVELLSLDFPRPVREIDSPHAADPKQAGRLQLLPTTLQAHPHRLAAYLRNGLRRLAGRNLWLYVRWGRSTNWVTLVHSLFRRALERGGVFHLWGHSWEIERFGQWQQLEEVLRFLGQFTAQAPALSNAEVCAAGGASAGAMGCLGLSRST